MTHAKHQPGADDHDQFDGRPAIQRFVERVDRRIGRSPSFAGAPSALPPSTEEVDYAAPTEVQAFREAGRRATETYPGPVGEFIARELETAAGFGFRFGTNALLTRLTDHLLGTQPATDTTVYDSDAEAGR
jgi:hypothetical protein